MSIGRVAKPGFLLGLYAAFFAVACVPIFAVDVLPLGDMLNHTARIYILNNLGSEPLLQKYYAVHWELFSFQSTDLLLPPLARWFGLDESVRLFTVFALALLMAGTAAVHRVLFRRVGLWPVAAILFLYNFPLMAGQVSYLFSTGLGLMLFAGWIASARWPLAIRLPLFAMASLGLMLCHFFAFAAYALLLISFAIGQARHAPTRGEKLARLVEAGLPFVPAALCFLWSFGGTVVGRTSYGELPRKMVAAFAGTMTYGDWPDIVLTVGVIGALWWFNRRKGIAFAPGMRLPMVVLGLIAIAMPNILRGVVGADLRLPCLLFFLIVAASDLRLKGPRQSIALGTGIFALLVVRVATMTTDWSHAEADYREFRAAEHVLDPGSRVAVIKVRLDQRANPGPQTPLWFVSCFAVIDRQIFLPQLYTLATPLRLAGEAEKLYSDTLAQDRVVRWDPANPVFTKVDPETVRQVERVGQRMSLDEVPVSTIDWSDWPERFDYLIDFHMGVPGNPVPALLTDVWQGSYFTIYRIQPPRHGG